ncbi:T9SS type B sorting domain-containing protein [Nonlabens marinus]|uniref:PKD domain-containing protein n=1 Tax=Nonlabens marinus S1-08 TaxID=1454201 RepID=W8W016_9FLAO|nr:T9SS type B sorting domain-containing protein [Nonlabens marinus]BAO55541.1 hypothetical protein NMS_1532 [Nonlabens marinus S1-08]
MKYFLLALFFMGVCHVHAQTVIEMPTNSAAGPTKSVGCGDAIFTDSGTTTANYSNATNGIIVFCPSIETDRMILDFSVMSILAGDVMTIYDGDSTAAPVLNTFSNTNTAPGVIQATASNSTGCLTVRFVSNATGTAAGWEARRRCFDPCQTITPTIITTPAIDPDGILRICQGDSVQFDGGASFSDSGAGATYRWDFNTGNGFVSGVSQIETFTESGSYQVRFEVTDANGCSDRDLIDLIVQVSNDPDFSGTVAADTSICIGETTTITGNVSTVPFVATPAPPVTGQTFLPDGTGVSYQTCIDVNIFSPGATLTDASDLVSMFMNLEHSWADDLDIVLTAPNGSSITILQTGQSNGEKYLGNPIDDETSNAPGTGFEYVITEAPGATTTFQNALAGSPQRVSLPAGDYLPTTSFSNFLGTNLNGLWCLTVTDNLEFDNGYIFEWGLNFDPALIPSELSFTPGEVREEWQPDPTIIATNGNVITVQPTAVGTKCYTYEYEDSFGCVYTRDVCIEVNPLPAPNPPNDLLVCDTVGNMTTVDLTQNTAVMLAGQPASSFQVIYYNQSMDAASGTNPITNPNTYPAATTSAIIYATVTDISTGCVVVLDFQVAINKAIFNAASDLVVCDDPSNDGIELFDLTQQINQIIGTQSSSEVSVQFFRSQAEANTASNPITNSASYTNENSPQQTIFVRVSNSADPDCFSTGSFELTVGGNPDANPVSDFQVCDDATNDGFANFNLVSKDLEILAGQSAADFEVSYYTNQSDANARQNALDKTAYQNTSNFQTIVGRIESRLNTECFDTTEFELIVNTNPILGTPLPIVVCDDPSGDGQELFDLTQNDADLLNGLSAADFQISYYLTQNDAVTATGSITSSYTSNQSTDDIFVRVENINTGCFTTTQFQIIINSVPQTAVVPVLEACDDNSDGLSIFRLNDRLDAIRNGQSGVTVSYFSSQNDALTATNPLNAETYQSTAASETIFYRSSFDATSCYTTGSFELRTVAPPIAATPAAVELCDSGDGTITYDLSNSSSAIQDGQSNTQVTYYNSQVDANSGNATINNTQTFTVDTTVFARLENTNTGCFDITVVQVQFGGLPNPQLPEEVVLCRDPQGMLVDGPAVLDTGLDPIDFSFEWTFDGALLPSEMDARLITEQQGIYAVTVTNRNSGCQITDQSLVRLAGAPDTFNIDITTQPFEDFQRIEISATGPDEYWFQLDDGLYQDSNVFENVTPGVHDITIAERNGCGSVTTQVFVYGYPKFFTPNNDGYNDTWNVFAGNRLPILQILIFDRYGKLLKQLNPTGAGWDGTFAGEPLPSTDYWFRLQYEFEGEVRESSGHFSMKR